MFSSWWYEVLSLCDGSDRALRSRECDSRETEQKATSTKPTSSISKKNDPDSIVPKKASLAIIYNEHDTIIEDPEDRKNPNNILFPFAIEDKTYYFVSPLLPKDQEKDIEPFFPTAKGREHLIVKDIYTHNFLKGKSFRNDPKTTFRGVDLFKEWYNRISPYYVVFWKTHGFFDLMRISTLGIKVHHWMIGVMAFF
ncbi:hypothetical protein PIB30_057387 [Stylosanthes scabra]|uniref:PiggyBac transposable element-derived protein domain-containing protein n=1 Tax=Stylosanthes scabra TaxID=79078 RepID=A0ABU6TJF4_9FABA|nr:hypothetical protein [Stylosanthes scabra]